jgi:predicted PurR-regulated permease PerM
VAVIAAITLIDAAAENLILPRMAGKDLNLSPFVVIFSVVFWGFVLGAVGVFLAVPLTVAVKLFLESWEESRWIGELMGAGEQQE